MQENKRHGSIVEWNDAKGYGFISSIGHGENIFIHVSSVDDGNRRPQLNDKVSFYLGKDARGRSKANNVVFSSSPPLGGLVWSIYVFVFFYVLLSLLGSDFLGIGVFALINYITYFYYAKDKKAAIEDRSRVPEFVLHLLAFLGGWPAALYAQKKLRHKTKKQAFNTILWVIIIIHLVSMFVYMAGFAMAIHLLLRLFGVLA